MHCVFDTAYCAFIVCTVYFFYCGLCLLGGTECIYIFIHYLPLFSVIFWLWNHHLITHNVIMMSLAANIRLNVPGKTDAEDWSASCVLNRPWKEKCFCFLTFVLTRLCTRKQTSLPSCCDQSDPLRHPINTRGGVSDGERLMWRKFIYIYVFCCV